jgi:hypothetical protein
MAGRDEQVLAALALVRPGDAHVRDVPLPQVIDEGQRVRRGLHDRRAICLQIQEGGAVGRLGIGRQHDGR